MYAKNKYPEDNTDQHNKSHIPKIMFLAAIGKPHMLPDKIKFVGKIEQTWLVLFHSLQQAATMSTSVVYIPTNEALGSDTNIYLIPNFLKQHPLLLLTTRQKRIPYE